MIKRYTRPAMGAVWSDENKYRSWLQVEIAVCEAQAELGHIPADAVTAIKKHADFSVTRIEAIEEEVKHDVIAFLTNVAEYVGDEARYIHLGMTSSDLLDTALALVVREAGAILIEDVQAIRKVLREQALAHKNTVCIGRSHGIHAEPTSFGFKFALWYDEMGRNLGRLQSAMEALSVGMISGAVGNYAYIDPRIEELACARLGLRPATISTQVIQRDVHAEFLSALALCGATLEKIAVEIRHLQRTEVLEAEEPFAAGQKGSSAMPHKRNPIGCENISGLARLLRSNALTAVENIALWHERDISHSSVERIIFPDSCILLDYMLARMTRILTNLAVYPERMQKNVRLTGGLIFSQAILLALTLKGMSREQAYKIVQHHAMRCWREELDLKAELKADKSVLKFLTAKEIDSCFDERVGLKQMDYIYRKVGIAE
ncbi:adenylosuccinate lyase [candidate division KSB1 bacterium]|nr:adenylosuccinate lyase [candidate division KSB1 bacterium]